MSYDYDRLFAQIIASVTSGGSITERMRAVIKECQTTPHKQLILPVQRLRQIPSRELKSDAQHVAFLKTLAHN